MRKLVKVAAATLALFSVSEGATSHIYTPLNVDAVFHTEDRWADRVKPVVNVSVKSEEAPIAEPFLEEDATAN